MYLYCSPRRAARNGFTHHAMFMGIFPGYAIPGPEFRWMSAIGLTIPLEIALDFAVNAIRGLLGLEPSTPFLVGEELEG